jgi:hypothetical protein
MKFTIFSSSPTTGKVPISENNVFSFSNVESSLEECHSLFENNFILSNPLIQDITSTRDSSLRQHYSHFHGYIILDFDYVSSLDDVESIITFFKNNNYAINIFKSRSYNGIDKFNIKAVLVVESWLDRTASEAIINILSDILEGLCEVDISVTRDASFQAPSFKNECIYYNYGKAFPHELVQNHLEAQKTQELERQNIKTLIHDYEDYSNIVKWFWEWMLIKYNATPKQKQNANKSYQIKLPCEKKSTYGYYWNIDFPWLIQHPQRSKTINMFSDFSKSDVGKKYLKNANIEIFKKYFSLDYDNSLYIQNNRYFDASLYEDCINDWINDDILVVKGIMGSGKSNIVDNVLQKDSSKVLFISMRKSLSYDLYSKYKDKYKVKHYLEHLNNTKTKYRPGDSLIIQIDSLHKINPNNFDTVIIDEFESLCIYTQQNMINSNMYSINMSLLYEIFTKKLLIMDAFINTFSLDLYFKDRKKVILQNTYKDTSEVYVYEHKETFFSAIDYFSNKESIISASFGTLSEMYTVKKLLEDKGLVTLVIDSSTSDIIKSIAQNMFKERTPLYNAILYSPTITVGVSILNDIQHHFHFDSGISIDPISSVQMLKRSRSAQHVHVYLNEKNTYQKIYDEYLLNDLLNQKYEDSLFSSSNMEHLFYDIVNKEINTLGKFCNKFVAHFNFYTNNHKNTCLFLLSEQFNSIKHITDKILVTNSKIQKIKRELKEENPYPLIEVIDSVKNTEDFTKIKENFYSLSDENILKILQNSFGDKDYINKIKCFMFYIANSEDQNSILQEYAILHQHNLNDKILVLLRKIKDVKKHNIKLHSFFTNNTLKGLLPLGLTPELLKAIGY